MEATVNTESCQGNDNFGTIFTVIPNSFIDFAFMDTSILMPVVVAAVVNMVLGAIWYSPAAFGKKWMELTGMKMDQKPEGMWKMYLAGFVISLVTAYVLGGFIALGADTMELALQTGFWLWLGFVATVTANGVLWGGKKKALWTLDNGYYLVAYLVMSAILFTLS